MPVWLGDGVRLFAPAGRELPLELVRSQAYPSGLVQLTYRVAIANERDGHRVEATGRN